MARTGKIRAKRFGFLEPGGAAKPFWCLRDDLKDLRRSLCERKRNGRKRLLTPFQVFDGIFPGTPQRWGVKFALAKLHEKLEERGAKVPISLATFRSWMRTSEDPARQRGLPADYARAFVKAAMEIPNTTRYENINLLTSELRKVPGSTGRGVSVLRNRAARRGAEGAEAAAPRLSGRRTCR
jgi:hypothetical protein